jgi:hypothetical protein
METPVSFGDQIAAFSLTKYRSLPQKGKPQIPQREWTVLAAIILIHGAISSFPPPLFLLLLFFVSRPVTLKYFLIISQ